MAAMKAALAYAFALLSVMVLIAPSAFADDTDLKKRLDQIASLCVESFNEQDAAGVAALFATNAIVVNRSGPQTDVVKFAEGLFKAGLNHIDATVDQVCALGPDTGIRNGPGRFAWQSKGTMGINFVNLTIAGPPDRMKPNVLIYEPFGKLVAVEWLVPLIAETKEKPTLLGQQFMGPMEGHDPFIPQQFVNCDLHAWIFKPYTIGMFAATNPEVKCDGYEHALLEPPTKHVHVP